MSSNNHPPTTTLLPRSPAAASTLRKRMLYLGVFILIAGLAAGTLIYVFSADTGSNVLANTNFDRRGYEFQIERMGGMAMVYVARFNDWLSGFWHGRQLGITVGVLATVLALVCFWTADTIAISPPAGADDGRRN